MFLVSIKIFENQYGVMYQSVRKVYIQGIIDGEMSSSNNNIFVEIDFCV